MMRLLLAIAFIAATSLPTAADAQVMGFSTKQKGNIEITSDEGIEWDRNKKLITVKTNALAKQGALSLNADNIEITYDEAGKKQDITLMKAIGSVVIKTGSETLTGDEAEYDPNGEVAVLTGTRAKLVTDKDEITANRFEFMQAKAQAVARGNVRLVSADGNTITAEVMVAHLNRRTNAVSRVEMFDGLVINTAGETVKGDKGVYNLSAQTIRIEGNVEIKQDRNTLKGDIAEVNLKTGVSRLRSTGANRIQGTVSPSGLKGQ